MTTCTYTFENGDVVKGVPALKAYLVEHPELVEAKAEEAPAPDQRKLWQMTQAEFLAFHKPTAKETAAKTWDVRSSTQLTATGLGERLPSVSNTEADKMGHPVRVTASRAKVLSHKKAVLAAINSGDAVPAEVLADYPDLTRPAQPQQSPADAQREQAEKHARDIGGSVVWQKDDMALVRGYSILDGSPQYAATKGTKRTRVDVEGYTGDMFTAEQKAEMVKAKRDAEAADAKRHAETPFITFKDGLSFSAGVSPELAGVVTEWKRILRLGANLHVTTIDDAKADREKFTGPHRAIGSTGLDANEAGSLRRLSNGDYYIAFSASASRVKTLETIAHELGHMHEKESYRNADPETKQAVRAEFDKWLASNKGKTARELIDSLRSYKNAREAKVGENTKADDLSAYWHSFSEWYADQTARWATSHEKPLTAVQQFFRRVGMALRRFYASASARQYLPSKTFVKYMEGVTEAAKADANQQGVAMLSRASSSAPQSLAEVESSWDSQGIENALSEKDGIITLHKIIVPKGEREAGIGTKAMQELLAYADATGQQVALTPSGDFGGNKRRLESFYRGLGFRTYKGFAVREKLIRDPANPDVRYSFAGQSAQTADTHALATAQARLAAGEDAETVRQETGWFRGVDGKWRYEIDDSQASIKGSGTVAEVFAQANAQSNQAADRLRERANLADRPRLNADYVSLGQILDHPALFAAYPELAGIRVTVGSDMGQTLASIRETGGGFEMVLSSGLSRDEALSAMLHEVQHGIQTIEGFASGGNLESAPVLDAAEMAKAVNKRYEARLDALRAAGKFDESATLDDERRAEVDRIFADEKAGIGSLGYRRLAGEVEARNTQARANLTPEQRRATPPSQTADVAESDVIVMFNGKEAAFAPPPANAKTRGTPLREVRALANRIKRSYANLPKVHVLASPADLPAEAAGLRAEIARQGAENDVEGAMFDGAIYLFADNLSSLERAEFVLAEHEVAHLGLRGFFGDNLEPVLRQIAVRNPKVREAAREAQKRGKLSLTAAVEEVLADMPTAELAKLKGWRKFVQTARDWFAGKGFERIAAKLDSLLQGAISEQEAADLYVAEVVKAARDWVKGGKGEAGKGAALSRSTNGAVSIERIGAAVDALAKSKEVRDTLFKSQAGAGPLDGGCLICAKALIQSAGKGSLLRVVTDEGQSIHYAAKIDGRIVDFSGVYESAGEWLAAYAPTEGLDPQDLTAKSGRDKNDSVADDEKATDVIAEMLSRAMQSEGRADGIRLSRAPAALKAQFRPGTGTHVIDDSGRSYTKDQREMFRATGREVEVKTVRDKVDELRADLGKKLAQGIFDQFAPVKDLSKHAYGLLRLAKGASGAFEVLMKGGKLKLEDGAYAFDKDQKGGVIDRLLVPLQGEGGDFLWWVAANRAGQLKAETAKAHAEGEKFRADAKDKEAQAQRLEAEAKQVLQQAGNFPKSALGNVRMQQQNARTAESLLREAKALRAEAAEDRKEATRLLSISRENLFTDEHIAAGKTLSDGETTFDYTLRHDHAGHKAGTVTRNRSLIYRDSLHIFNEFNKNALDMAEQSGLIDPESRKVWEREFYVPFYRVSEDEGGIKGVNVKNGYVRQEAFKHLKGGKDKLNSDLLENTLMNWAHLIDAAAKNRGAVATLVAGEKAGASAPNLKAGFSWVDGKVIDDETGLPAGGAGEVKPEYTTAGKGTVWAMIGGKQAHYAVSDPYVLTAITALEYAGLRGPVMDVMSKFKNVLTIGVTASPFFKIRNLIRDSLQAIATTDLDYNPAKNVKSGLDAVNAGEAGKNFLKAAANAATMGKAGFKLNETHTDEYFDMLAGGGLIRFGTMLEGSEAKRTRALVEKGVDPDTILDNESKVTAFYKRVVEPLIESYNELGNKSEEITRAALYRKLRKEGRSHLEASLEARDTMDFSMQGSFASVRFLTQVVPFMNARLQGLYKLGRAHNQDKRRFYAVVGATTLVSLALLAAYGDDDDWKRREEWDRDNYWWLKIGGEAIRIPKPFEVGALATLAERSAEYLFDDEMNGSRFRDRVLSLLSSQLAMNPVPQAFKPLIDLYANQDSFTGRPIETMGMERLDPSYRFTMNTSAAARAISSAGNAATSAVVGEEKFLSPVQVDHILRAYFGWLGSFVTGGVDMMVDAASDGPAKPSRDVAKFFTGGMLAELDGAPSRYVSQMYEQAKELDQAYATWNHLKKEGKTEEAAEYLEANQEDIARYRSVERVKKGISGLTKEIRAIERSDLDPTVKRERINALRNRQNEIAKTL